MTEHCAATLDSADSGRAVGVLSTLRILPVSRVVGHAPSALPRFLAGNPTSLALRRGGFSRGSSMGALHGHSLDKQVKHLGSGWQVRFEPAQTVELFKLLLRESHFQADCPLGARRVFRLFYGRLLDVRGRWPINAGVCRFNGGVNRGASGFKISRKIFQPYALFGQSAVRVNFRSNDRAKTFPLVFDGECAALADGVMASEFPASPLGRGRVAHFPQAGRRADYVEVGHASGPYAALVRWFWSAWMPSSISRLIASPWLRIRFENIQSSRACICSAVVKNWTRSSFLGRVCMSLMPCKVCAFGSLCNMLMLLDLLMFLGQRLSNLLMFSSFTDKVPQ